MRIIIDCLLDFPYNFLAYSIKKCIINIYKNTKAERYFMSKKSDLRRQNILNDIINKTNNTQESLMHAYSVQLRTLKEDIRSLRDQGYNIVSKKGTYILEAGATDNELSITQTPHFYQATDKIYLRKLIILLLMQQAEVPLSESDIISLYQKYSYDEGSITSATLRTAISELTHDKLISATADGYYKVSKNAPVYLQLSDDDTLNIINLINSCGSSHPFYKELKNIASKLSIAFFNEESGDSEQFHLTGRTYDKTDDVSIFLNKLNSLSFETKIINIKYDSTHKGSIDINMAIGLVIYSADRDALYLIGRVDDNDYILNTTNVIEMTECEEVNKHFHSQYYLNMLDQMFSISADPVNHVVVEFQNKFDINNKLKRLVKQRPFASLTYDNEKEIIIYEDDIRGLYDFANYLRRYGKSARVLEPKFLQEIMYFSASRILDRYKEEGYYE